MCILQPSHKNTANEIPTALLLPKPTPRRRSRSRGGSHRTAPGPMGRTPDCCSSSGHSDQGPSCPARSILPGGRPEGSKGKRIGGGGGPGGNPGKEDANKRGRHRRPHTSWLGGVPHAGFLPTPAPGPEPLSGQSCACWRRGQNLCPRTSPAGTAGSRSAPGIVRTYPRGRDGLRRRPCQLRPAPGGPPGGSPAPAPFLPGRPARTYRRGWAGWDTSPPRVGVWAFVWKTAERMLPESSTRITGNTRVPRSLRIPPRPLSRTPVRGEQERTIRVPRGSYPAC